MRPRFVSDLVEEMAHRYLDEVELDLSALRAETEGTLRGRTFLGEVKAGEWELDVAVDDLRGRLQAGHPRLRFHSDRIEIEMPVKVRPAFGTITLDFAWDSAGLANVVCSDFQLSRKLEGTCSSRSTFSLDRSVSARLPAQLERQVTLGNRVLGLSVKSEAVRVRSDLLWTSGSIAVGSGGTLTGRESAPGRLDPKPPDPPPPDRRLSPQAGGLVANACARSQE